MPLFERRHFNSSSSLLARQHLHGLRQPLRELLRTQPNAEEIQEPGKKGGRGQECSYIRMFCEMRERLKTQINRKLISTSFTVHMTFPPPSNFSI